MVEKENKNQPNNNLSARSHRAKQQKLKINTILAFIFGVFFLFGLIILALLFLHYAISGTGAIILWEGANVAAFTNNQKGDTETFKIADIKDIRIGKGWERKGLWFVIPYVIPMNNKISEGLCVSFEAPDSITGKDVVYAFLLHSKEETKNFINLLK